MFFSPKTSSAFSCCGRSLFFVSLFSLAASVFNSLDLVPIILVFFSVRGYGGGWLDIEIFEDVLWSLWCHVNFMVAWLLLPFRLLPEPSLIFFAHYRLEKEEETAQTLSAQCHKRVLTAKTQIDGDCIKRSIIFFSLKSPGVGEFFSLSLPESRQADGQALMFLDRRQREYYFSSCALLIRHASLSLSLLFHL